MATIVGNTALGYLQNEATSLIEQAKRYREEINRLPEGDKRREVYEQVIRDLLDRANRISTTVTTTVTSTSSSSSR